MKIELEEDLLNLIPQESVEILLKSRVKKNYQIVYRKDLPKVKSSAILINPSFDQTRVYIVT